VADLLVKLYELPPERSVAGIDIRRALAPEKHAVVAWIDATFGARWASEADVAFFGHPIRCHIATVGGELRAVACWDATARGFFGPEGVAETSRGTGIGGALLLQCLHAMRAHGYAYAVIGGVGPKAFYEKIVPVMEIPGSSPGIYHGMLR
jgi:GNAT superfamily N-acetyltransferase